MFNIGDRVKCAVGKGFPESFYDGTVLEMETVTEKLTEEKRLASTGRFGVKLDTVPFHFNSELYYFNVNEMVLIEG